MHISNYVVYFDNTEFLSVSYTSVGQKKEMSKKKKRNKYTEVPPSFNEEMHSGNQYFHLYTNIMKFT
jgi:hypothetical protein